MKRKFLVMTILAVLFFSACKKDDPIEPDKPEPNKPEEIQKTKLSVELQKPEAVEDKNPTIKEMKLIVKNVNTGADSVLTMSDWSIADVVFEEGLYNIQAEGIVCYTDTSGEVCETVRGRADNIELTGSEKKQSIPMFLYANKVGNGFVISEIYFTGSWNSAINDNYRQDKFIEIYNNSDQTLYADGLCIAESALNTAMKLNELTPDVRQDSFLVQAVYRVPGSGQEHPVEPGKTLVLCDVGKNHQEESPDYLDLSKADFEWYDNHALDVDVPEVSNLQLIVKKSKSIWSLHDRGWNSYAIFKLDDTEAANFPTTNVHHYQYHFVFGTVVDTVMQRDSWIVANDKIIDAVECSTPSKFEWKSLSPSLDFSWTHSGDADDKRYSHSVKRKISHKFQTAKGDIIILTDSNNSEEDFVPTAPNPSPGMVEDHHN
ncbi:MAG: hypothetical protein CSB06_00110 [Bacteroidia bacterium]|nr:MAG: hypothetical protein CSB06_00110 [Bacteroidia bacterium]